MIAIAADEVEDLARLQASLPALTLLSDRALTTSAAWGLREGDAEVPSPATFVVDRDGNVTWRHVGRKGADWPGWDALAAALGL